MFSRRTTRSLAPNRLSEALERWPVRFDLTVSNPTQVGLSEPVTLPAAEKYQPEPFGLRSAREAVARWYGGIALERVLLGATSSEAYQALMQLTADPGDGWLVPAPGYPLLDELARLNGVELARYPLRFDGQWVLDVDRLAGAANERTRAVVIVSPANPTGHRVEADELAAVDALCAARGWALIIDEVFESPERSTLHTARRSFGAVMGGLSKAAGQPQLKLGWSVLTGPDAQVSDALARLEMIHDTFLSLASPVQLALPSLLEASAAFRARVSDRVRLNLATLVAARPPGARWDVWVPEAGWSVVLRIPAVPDEETVCLSLLEHDGVRVQPGHFYDFPSGRHLVLSLLPEPAVFTAGVERLVARLALR